MKRMMKYSFISGILVKQIAFRQHAFYANKCVMLHPK